MAATTVTLLPCGGRGLYSAAAVLRTSWAGDGGIAGLHVPGRGGSGSLSLSLRTGTGARCRREELVAEPGEEKEEENGGEEGVEEESDPEEQEGAKAKAVLRLRIRRLRALKRAALIREIMVRRQLLLASSMVVGVTLSTALAPWVPDLHAVAAFLEDIPELANERELRGQPLALRVPLPDRSSPAALEDEEPEEVLVIAVKVLRGRPLQFDVFLNLPEASDRTPTSCAEYVGSFFNEPQTAAPDAYREAVLRLGITDTLDQLGLGRAPSVVVSIVPRGLDTADSPIVVKGIRVEFE